MVNILLAEDNEVLRELIFEVLSGKGFNVATASDGLEALDLLKRKKFDLIISDYQMPHMTGAEVVDWCKKNSIDSQVIFLTANAESLILEESFKKYSAEVLRKPVSIKNLLDAIERVMKGVNSLVED